MKPIYRLSTAVTEVHNSYDQYISLLDNEFDDEDMNAAIAASLLDSQYVA